jgi:hypothetical protein
LHPLVGQRRAGDLAAPLFKRPAILGSTGYSRVQAEALHFGTQVAQILRHLFECLCRQGKLIGK